MLISSIETIKKYIHNSEMVCQVFIDLLNTFDTVNHGVLLEKLKHYGIRGKPINLFWNLRSHRKQYGLIESFFSQTKITKCVFTKFYLGPLLFLIYINDLFNTLEKSIVHNFADNTNFLYGSKNPFAILDVINSEH